MTARVLADDCLVEEVHYSIVIIQRGSAQRGGAAHLALIGMLNKDDTMKKFDAVSSELSQISKRHDSFKDIYKKFQQSISHVQDGEFPVKGITLDNISDEITSVSFIGRNYERAYSNCMADGVFKGKISVFRVLNESSRKEISSITYNGQSVVDVDPPQGEDPIALAEDSCRLNMVLNWLSSEINE